jgi:hypothetical protein
MKSSAAVIAESLSEFGRCLRETELPNDVETTQRILDAQTAERDAIKVSFLEILQVFLVIVDIWCFLSTWSGNILAKMDRILAIR